MWKYEQLKLMALGSGAFCRFLRLRFHYRSTRSEAKEEECDNDDGSYAEIDISRMNGIEDGDDGTTRYKISNYENVYTVFTSPDKKNHVDGKAEVSRSENGTKRPSVEEYMEPIKGCAGTRELPVSEIYLDAIAVDARWWKDVWWSGQRICWSPWKKRLSLPNA